MSELPEAGWFRQHLLEDILPHWLAAAPTQGGLFLTHLDREWRAHGPAVGTLVSQSRLLFDFAQGWHLTGHPGYRAAVENGARFLLDHFRDEEHGGCFWEVGQDGSVRDDRKDAYGHAFAIFGLAHAFGATRDDRFQQAALSVWETVRTRLQEPAGGVVRSTARDFSDPASGRSQNPVMHLLEALLALCEHGGDPIRQEAARIAGFVVGDLVRRDDGALPELYDDRWQPLPAGRGGRIEVGHQFEWAWLLSQAAALSVPGDWIGPAHRLLDAGMRLGYDAGQGGIFSSVTPEGELQARGKGWWEQCEAARAMMRFATFHGRDDLAGPLRQTLDLIRTRFVDPTFGGWFMRVEPDGTVRSTEKGSPWKVDYHVVGMCLEGMRARP